MRPPAPPWRRRGLRAAKELRERGAGRLAPPRGEVLRREAAVREAELRRRRRAGADGRRRPEELAGRRRRRRG